MWNLRLLSLPDFSLHPRAEYADLLENTLYNAVLPGLSLDGQTYFYENPLSDEGAHRRTPWFECACCPPNVARLLAQLPGYFYGTRADEIWVHLYAANSAHLQLENGQIIDLETRTNYPWDGEIDIEVKNAGEFSLNLRVPAWCENATLKINGEDVGQVLAEGFYAEIKRDWQAGDRVQLSLPMPVRRMISHPYILENVNHTALMRGPILYAIEAVDHDFDLHDLVLPRDAEITAQFESELLNGVVTLNATAQRHALPEEWTSSLYRSAARASQDASQGASALKAIPYYAWANRAAGQMRVWLREK